MNIRIKNEAHKLINWIYHRYITDLPISTDAIGEEFVYLNNSQLMCILDYLEYENMIKFLYIHGFSSNGLQRILFQKLLPDGINYVENKEKHLLIEVDKIET